ncbi:hypothetical protein NDU88_009415 [Pleurodeles waltl]|uniref:Uncharacterized protein n=1 Tax=Pleurodeles waltl TaxID=8319 RepID=A0AAV7PUX8_PLEWA|nr:hypothetical protein NDU88_009415 [Pleurodeles waltl]
MLLLRDTGIYLDGRGRDALGWEAPRVGVLKVSGWCAQGCLGAAVAPGAAPDELVRPGAGLDLRSRRQIAAEIPDWAVCCARRRIRTRAHPEGGGADRSDWWRVGPLLEGRNLVPPGCGTAFNEETGAPLWVHPPGGRTIGAPVLEAQGPADADDGTLYAQDGPRRALIVLCEAGQCGIALRHPPSTARVGGQVPLFPGAGPPWLTEPVPIWRPAASTPPTHNDANLRKRTCPGLAQDWFLICGARRTHDRLVRGGPPEDPGLSALDRMILYRGTDAALDALGWEAPRVGALKVSGWCARGCLGAAVAPGAAPDEFVRPGAGLDLRGRCRIAAEIPDWAVCCARRRIRTRAHPEGGGVRIGATGGELAPCSRGRTWCLLAAELHSTRRRGARFGYAPLGDAQSVRRCWKPRGPRMPTTGLSTPRTARDER